MMKYRLMMKYHLMLFLPHKLPELCCELKTEEEPYSEENF